MADPGKVVSINGRRVVAPGTAVDSLVGMLEALLEQARAGEIVGVIGSAVYPSQGGYTLPASTFWAGYTDSTSSLGALEDAKFNILRRLNP